MSYPMNKLYNKQMFATTQEWKKPDDFGLRKPIIQKQKKLAKRAIALSQNASAVLTDGLSYIAYHVLLIADNDVVARDRTDC